MHILKGRYEIQKTLGDRYGCKTFLARDRHTQTFVVIKQLLFHSDLKWETLRLFEREANTLKSLNHPAIPRYLDYFDVETEAGKGFALVQSFIAADSLRKWVSMGRRFKEIELKAIARKVLSLLAYLHSHQPPVIHRDIKPSNILLSDMPKEGHTGPTDLISQIFLIDFGSVQAMQTEDGTRTVVGTYGYMPPEQFGDRAVPASDMYGLGTTLINLASGQAPADLPQSNLRLQFEAHVSLSRPFMSWLSAMTSPALEERFSSAQQALQALDSDSSLRFSSRSKASLPLTIKPLGSRISLTKDFERLEVIISPIGSMFAFLLTTLSITTFALVVAVNTAVVWLFFSAFNMSIVGLIVVIIGLVYLGIPAALINILQTLSSVTVLTFDKQTVVLRRKILGLSVRQPERMAYEHSITVRKAVPPNNKTVRFQNVRPTITQLNVRTVDEELAIGDNRLTAVEIDWLVSEINEWLALPVVSQPSLSVGSSPSADKIALYGEDEE